MSHFHDRFKQHVVHQTLLDLSAAIDSAKPELGDSAQIAGYERFRRVVEHAKEALAAVDPEFVNPSALKAINNAATTMKAHHEAFLNSKDWQNLNQPADQMLDHLRMLPHRNGESDGRLFAGALEGFQQRAGDILDGTRAKAEQIAGMHQKVDERLGVFDQKIVAFEQQFETQKGRIDTLISEQQNQFTQRLTTYDAQVAEQKGRIDTLISDQQAQFAQRAEERTTKFTEQQARFEQSETARSQQFIDHLTEFRNDFAAFTTTAGESVSKAISEERSRFDSLIANYEGRAGESIQAMKSRLEEAVRIVGLIGNTGLTGNYQRVANDENKIARSGFIT